MKNSNIRIILPSLAIVTVIAAGVVGVGTSFAHENGDGVSIVQRIAEKFGLSEDDVQAVFDEERESHQQEMQQREEERLSNLVSEGKITEEQRQAIFAKKEDMRSQMEANRPNKGSREEFDSLTEEERHVKMEERKVEMEERQKEIESWLEENGISEDVWREIGFGGGLHGGHSFHVGQ
ncbi:MAG: hypothetical protein KC736_01665 [Candidatus Moranbacteria bacterium]|nr:hypothetical protein [Candidatus Moranbacteria bacterium]